MFTEEEIEEVNKKTMINCTYEIEVLLKSCTDVQLQRFSEKYPKGVSLDEINEAMEILKNFISHNRKVEREKVI